MDEDTKAMIWQQFGAAIDMLDNAIVACPVALWSDRARQPEFWYVAFHTLFWLDFYLTPPTQEFVPPAPFTLDELDPAGIMPARAYSPAELRHYLAYGRARCRSRIEAMTPEGGRASRKIGGGAMSEAELLLYGMRHVQHHAAQLNLLLRQKTDSAPRWVARARTADG